MNHLSLKKTFTTPLAGIPGRKLVRAEKPGTVAVCPSRIPFVKPRLLVKPDHGVSIGTPLFEDKRDTSIRFLSPGGGTVEEVKYGPRRIIEEIVIRLDEDETSERFEPVSREAIDEMPLSGVVDLLKNSGMWPYLRQLPFRDTAGGQAGFPMVIVSLRPGDMYSPFPSVFLEGRERFFEFGLFIMSKLARKVVVVSPQEEMPRLGSVKEYVTHVTGDRYPSGDPGVILYRIRESSFDNTACYIDAQDLSAAGELFLTGVFPVQRVYALAGSPNGEPVHILARQGSPVQLLTGPAGPGKAVITRGVFDGYKPGSEAHMGFFDTSAIVLAQAQTDEVFGFIRPGTAKVSESRTFLSRLRKGPLFPDTGIHGEERACVNCGLCEENCPVDLFPHFLMKALAAGEMEEVISMGLLDCTGCGLCTYVCPSKISLAGSFRSAKQAYYKERG